MLETEIKPWETPEGIAREDAVIARAATAFNTPEATEARIRKALEEFPLLPPDRQMAVLWEHRPAPAPAKEIKLPRPTPLKRIRERVAALDGLKPGTDAHTDALAKLGRWYGTSRSCPTRAKVLSDLLATEAKFSRRCEELRGLIAGPVSSAARARAGEIGCDIANEDVSDACDEVGQFMWDAEDGAAIASWSGERPPECPGTSVEIGCGSPVAKGATRCARCEQDEQEKVTP